MRLFYLLTSALIVFSCAYHNQWRSEKGNNDPEIFSKSGPVYTSTDSAIRIDKKSFYKFRQEIKTFWRAPYVWGGASPEGTDCSGFIVALYRRAVGKKLPHSTRLLFQKGSSIDQKRLGFADLVFFSFKNPHNRLPDHVGFYIKDNYFIHASVSKGVSLDNLNEKPYASLYIGARRVLR